MRLGIKSLIQLIVTLFTESNSLILRLPCGDIYADFSIVRLNHILQGSVIETINGITDLQCTAGCAEHPLCQSYNIHRDKKICHLNSKKEGDYKVTVLQSAGWLYKSTDYNETLVGRTCKALDPCPKNVLCKDKCDPPYYQCVYCNKGYTGLHCDKATSIDHCADSPCKNGGACQSLEPSGYSCKCPNGYNGKNCEVDIDECDSLPCFNGGTCINEINDFRCNCVSAFTGRHCEADFNECDSDPCLNGGTCVNQFNSFKCNCAFGFEGNSCEKEINPCLSNPCMNDGTCNNHVTHFTCTCSANYGGLLCRHPHCNRLLTAPSGEIISKNYPSNYPLSHFCYWVIQAAPGSRIKVVFHDLLLEQRYNGCVSDYVQLFSGKMSSAPSIGGKFCATDKPGTRVSSGNIMRIEFRTDGAGSYRGFNLTWNTIT